MRRFIEELSERHVIKVGVAYLAIAWLVIQLASEIGPILGAPDPFYKLMLVILALGFLVTLVLSWVYELTNKGLKRSSEVDADETIQSVGGRGLDLVVIGALVLALGYFIWESRFADSDVATDEVLSIAVLPFRDLSADRDQAWFAEGMAEEIMSSLSRLPNLRVTGRISAFAFTDTQKDVRAVASELGVSHILEGSVRTSGNQLRVTAKLVSAADGFQVWSREFDREMREVFALQDEISTLVINGLRLHLDDMNVADSRPSATTTTDAYNAYLIGRYHLARRTAESIATAKQKFEEALDLDDKYSPAHSALAKTLAISPYYDPLASATELADSARQSAERAIEINPTNSEAYAVLGTVRLIFDRDWNGATEMVKRSVDLGPNDAGNLNLYGDFLYTIGDYRSAVKYEGLAAELEPLSALHQHELALVLELLGKPEEAVTQEKLAVELDPDFANAWWGLGKALWASGRLEDLDELLETNSNKMTDSAAAHLRLLLAMGRDDPMAISRSGPEFIATLVKSGNSLGKIAYAHALLGDDSNAADFYEQAYAASDPIITSPQYLFLPEDWPNMPLLHAAMDKTDLRALFDLRRAHIADGSGRALFSATSLVSSIDLAGSVTGGTHGR